MRRFKRDHTAVLSIITLGHDQSTQMSLNSNEAAQSGGKVRIDAKDSRIPFNKPISSSWAANPRTPHNEHSCHVNSTRGVVKEIPCSIYYGRSEAGELTGCQNCNAWVASSWCAHAFRSSNKASYGNVRNTGALGTRQRGLWDAWTPGLKVQYCRMAAA